MLNDGAAVSPPSHLPPPPQAQRSFPPPVAGRQRTQLLSLQRSRLRFIYFGAGTALIGALALLFVLFHNSRAVIPKTRAAGPAAKSASVPAAQPRASNTATPVAAPPTEAPKQQETASSEPVQFRIKRSRTFETVGPIRLRLVKANPRWNTCNLYLASGGPSFQKQFHLNKPVQINLPDGSGTAELVVTNIRADQISGSVQQKQ